MLNPPLKLQGFTFQQLFQPDGLQKLDQKFLTELQRSHPQLHDDLLAYRQDSREFSPIQISELLIAGSTELEAFLARFFNIEEALEISKLQTLSNDPIFVFKKWYVLREAKRRLAKMEELESFTELEAWLKKQVDCHSEPFAALEGRLREESRNEKAQISDSSLVALAQNDSARELAIAKLGQFFLSDPQKYQVEIEKLIHWCVRAMTDPEGQVTVKDWVSFRFPAKLDYQNLVPMISVPDDAVGRFEGPPPYRHRDGFKLTDPRMTPRQVLNEVHYCVYCHEHDGDFCSKGFPEKKTEPERGLKINPLGDPLTGCPLDEKISEMHVLKKVGHTIASLAMVMADNPMCPVTGHRICNDCMKACIYQKQEPVNIPQTETGVLTDVLKLPWGVEIYDLLTRWNPLRKTQWVAKPYNGLKALIMGMGPAGFTLAHHLLMEGFAVVGVDGLKIEPLPKKYLEQPIYHYDEIRENLDTRVMAGFGGVAEYGITVRWDKNFLKLIYISLMRRPYFQAFGGVRFGGTITVEDAWELGFDHLAIAVGAGLPKELPIPGSLAPGMRQANDFLMALQLTGAAKKASLANLQMRLPAVVIGGGLTGIDTATEAQAYYITQVEKTLERYETLAKILGEARIREQFDENSFAVLNEFLAHGKAVREERARAKKANETPNFNPLIREWGGVTIAYRRLLRESPAYKRNHEEVIKAFEEGIYYAEGLDPIAARLDKQGHVEALVCQSRTSNEEFTLPAKSIFVATGARPNIAYEFEHRGTFAREGMEYRTYEDENDELIYIPPDGHVKTKIFGAFTSYKHDHRYVTFLGDTHPVFHGSVVKAIASAKRIYPKILQCLDDRAKGIGDLGEYQKFAEKIQHAFGTHILKIKRHTPSVVELVVHAPMAAKNFRPGQFYRIQNFETLAPIVNGTQLQTEALALLAADADKEKGRLSFMVLEKGASSRLIATLKQGQPISVMGPTGVRSKIPQDRETVMIIGGRISIAYVRALGTTLRAAGNQVLYVACLQTADELYCQKELEKITDKIIYITQTGDPIKTHRKQDIAITGEFISVLLQLARDKLINLQDVNRVSVIGTHRLIRLVREGLEQFLKEYLVKNPPIFASVYGPMQCMLKGVCAQCLQWQIDPQTGKRTKAVFACSWQDQPLDAVDLDNLSERLMQNRTQEILTNLWLDYLFTHYGVERI